MTTDLTPSSDSDYRFAVAVHEAGHGVVGACLDMEITKIRLVRPDSKPGGYASSGPGIPELSDFLAPFPAGSMAVEEVCGDYRLPIDEGPNSDEAQFGKFAEMYGASHEDQARARRTARRIVHAQRMHVIAIANALLATPEGFLAGNELQAVLAPVRKACRE